MSEQRALDAVSFLLSFFKANNAFRLKASSGSLFEIKSVCTNVYVG